MPSSFLTFTQTQDDNTFAHPLASFPVRRPGRSLPTFDDRGEPPPAHVPSFLPAFPDPHTYERTPVFPGHEENPDKQTQVGEALCGLQPPPDGFPCTSLVLYFTFTSGRGKHAIIPQFNVTLSLRYLVPKMVKQQRRVAEKALLGLHKRSKKAMAAPGAEAPSDEAGAGEASKEPPSADDAKRGGSLASAAAAGEAAKGSNPFLALPLAEGDGGGGASRTAGGSGSAPVSDSAFQVGCPNLSLWML